MDSNLKIRAPNIASQNIVDKYPNFCPLNFRCDPKIGILPKLSFVEQELHKFVLMGDLTPDFASNL